jgi:hypothetical protein
VRIASIHIPSFPLQAAIQSRSEQRRLANAPVAVLHASAPVVTACSRAAWALGVRPGMAASVARAHAPELIVKVRAPAREAELVRAVADRLLALSPHIDLGGPITGLHHAMYVEVPAGRRGAAFGAKLVEACREFDLHVRVGIADDRFTATVAATAPTGPAPRGPGGDADGAVTCVPRGGSAAFLAPLPLALLNLAPEVQHMLESLGVATLGAFAALPPPSVARDWDGDLQALARGDGGARLDLYQPAPSWRERVAVEGTIGLALQELANRIAVRLFGRGGQRARIAVAPVGGAAVEVVVDGPITADELGDRLARAVGTPTTAALDAVIAVGDEPVASTPADAAAPAAEAKAPAAPLLLTPVPSILGERPEHRRTRRGKHRPRIAHGQARLFASE